MSTAETNRPPRRLALAAIALGLASTGSQLFLLRDLAVSAAGDEASLGLGLASWLAGIASGALALRRLPPGTAGRLFPYLLAAVSLSGGAAIGGRLLRAFLAPPAGELPGLGLALVLAAATLSPAGAAVGAAFASLGSEAGRIARQGAGRLLGEVYALESLGSLLSGLAATLLSGVVPPFTGCLALGLASVALAAPLAWPSRAARGALLGAGLLVAAALAAAPRIDSASEAVRSGSVAGAPVVAVADTPLVRLVLTGDGMSHLWVNGRYALSFPDPYAVETGAHLAATFAERTKRILVLGGAAHGPLRHLLLHGVERLDLVDADPAALAFLAGRLPPEDRRALDDPRVRVDRADPRSFLAAGGEPYDLLLLPPLDPSTLARARLTTVEFFRACASRTAPRGVLVLPLRTAPTALEGDTASLTATLFSSLRRAYPVVRVTPGPDSFLLAGSSPEAVSVDPALLAGRFRERGIRTGGFAPELFPALLVPDRVAAFSQEVEREAARAHPSTDDRPASFAFALSRAERESGSFAGKLLSRAAALPAPLLVLLVAGPVLLLAAASWLRPPTLRAAAAWCVGAGGAAGMAWTLVLLLSFQIRQGALYRALGLLTAAFMLGLALGAYAAGRLLGCLRPAPGRALAVTAALAGTAGLGVAAALRFLASLGAGGGTALASHALLLLISGLATGALFPAATGALLASDPAALGAAARFETADHAGAALSALVTVVVFVPRLGLATTALLASLLLLAAAAGAVRAR